MTPRNYKRGLKVKLLAITTVITALSPVTVFADPLGEKDWQNKVPNHPTAPVELMNYRTTQSQTFLNPDGTFTTKLYPTDIFFKDNSGNWKNIDNSLASDGNGGFQNKLGPYTVDFPSTLANSGAISISANPKYKVTMTVNGATETSPATTSGNTIKYSGVESGDDLSYIVEGHQVKESITLNSASANTAFSFTLHAPGITFTKQTDGSIVGTVTGTHHNVFTLPAPFMTDAKGVRSNAVTTSLSTNANGDTVLTVTADSTWLNDPSRAFPVVVDPSVGVAPGSQTGVDTSFASGYPTSSYYTDQHLYAGYASGYNSLRSLLRFDNLPNLLPGGGGATITNVTLSLYQDSANEGGLSIEAIPVTGPWQSNTATWNNQPTYSSTALDTQSKATSNVSSSSPYVGVWNFNVTSAVQQVYNAQQPNYGFLLRAQNESSTTTDAAFASSDNTTEGLPSLNITYTINPIGTDAAWMHAGPVNVAGGDLAFPQTDLTVSGRGPQVAITRMYNSKNLSTNEGFGNGWSSNIFMHLNVKNLPGPILFTDATGLVHVFAPTNNNSGVWVDSGSEHQYIVQGTNGFTLYGSYGSQILFSNTGQLISISSVDSNSNMQTVSFAYNSSGQLASIKDASGRNWNVTFNNAGLVSQIVDPDSRTAAYSYDSNNNLTGVSISPPSSSSDTTVSTTKYAYSSTAPQFVVTDPAGNQTQYSFNSNNAVTSISGTVEGTAASTSYNWGTVSTGNYAGDSEVTVTDPTGHAVEYVTNANGNVLESIVNPGATPSYTTTYTWDQNDEITAMTDPNGNLVKGTYNSDGNLIQYTNGNGVVYRIIKVQKTAA